MNPGRVFSPTMQSAFGPLAVTSAAFITLAGRPAISVTSFRRIAVFEIRGVGDRDHEGAGGLR